MISLSPKRQNQQPKYSMPLDLTVFPSPIGLYLGSVGEIDLVTGIQMTKGSAYSRRACAVGIGSQQDANNTGCYVSRIPPSLIGYVAVWHGILIGSASGSTPKLMGIANTAVSQTLDVIGIEILSSTDLQINFKSGVSNANRSFSNSMPGTGVPVTIVGVYDSVAAVCRLHVCENGKLTSYTSTSIASPSAPTILGTEVFVVGPDVIEIPSRYPNANIVLAAIGGLVGGPEAERRLALNPWSMFSSSKRSLEFEAAAAAGFFSRYYYDMPGAQNV